MSQKTQVVLPYQIPQYAEQEEKNRCSTDKNQGGDSPTLKATFPSWTRPRDLDMQKCQRQRWVLHRYSCHRGCHLQQEQQPGSQVHAPLVEFQDPYLYLYPLLSYQACHPLVHQHPQP